MSQNESVVPNQPSTPPADHYDYLIIGGGMVGDQAAKGVQEIDPNAGVGIFGADPDEPVTRPALTKKLWTDPDFGFDQVWLKTVEQTGADLFTRSVVQSLDPGRHQVTVDDRTVGYRRLLLATGGRPNELDLPHDDRIVAFRTVDDYRRLRRLSGRQRLIGVVGGGYIGTELAAGMVQNDTRVIMMFPEQQLYGSRFPEHLSTRLTKLYVDHQVELRPKTMITGGTVDESGIRLSTDDGDQVRVDAVVVGLGITPSLELAEQAGLRTDDGIVVDEYLTTSDPDILAAGDVASYPDRILGRQRVEHVDNANAMGRLAGRNLAGAGERYQHSPYFYSVMFGHRYEAVGSLDATADLVEDWSDDQERGVVYYLDDQGVVGGVLLWNVNERTDDARRVITRSQAGELTRDQLPGTIPPM